MPRLPQRTLAVLSAAAVVVGLLIGGPAVEPPSAAAKPELVAKSDPLPPDQQRARFRLPPGFEIQLVAAEPQIHKPMNICFDDRGRLWVTDTLEYPFPAKPGVKPRDTVKILEDFDETGRARKVTTFADGLNIPIGLLPLPTAPGKPTQALVFGIPEIRLFTDTDGDGRADKSEVVLGTYGFRDTHGMTNAFTLGFDGWVYACHGFSNSSDVKAADGSKAVMSSGNTYRFRPDGSRVEQFTWGQVNPFGLCLDPFGDLYSADCHSRPLYQLLRGAYYPSFGKPHDGLGFGPEMCRHDHGSTAIAGILYYDADQYPAEYRDTLFVGNVVTNRINHDKAVRKGSSVKAVAAPDFVSCDDPWFRPVDIRLAPDGCLYVADFYNRIIGHYEVPLTHPGRDRERGRIWRIVYRGPDGKAASPAAPKDFGKATAEQLAADLGAANLAVRMMAMHQLVARGKDSSAVAAKVLAEGTNPRARAHALWAVELLGGLDEAAWRKAAGDAEAVVRVHAMRVASERPVWSADVRSAVTAGLKDADPLVRRAAADALGRHPDADAVRPLMDLLSATPGEDDQLIHTARMALRDQFRKAETWSAVAAKLLEAEADSRAVADVAVSLPGAESAAFVGSHLGRWSESGDRRLRMIKHVARHGSAESAAAVIASARSAPPKNPADELALFRAIQQGLQERGGKMPETAAAWAGELVPRLLNSHDGKTVTGALEMAAAMRLEPTRPAISALLADRRRPADQRKAAAVALAKIKPAEGVADLARVLAAADEDASVREAAALALGGANLPAARAELITALKTAPERLQTVIAAAVASGPAGAEELLAAVAAGKASARMLTEKIVQARLTGSGLGGVEARIAELTKGLPAADKKVAALIAARRAAFGKAKADPAAGAAVFEKHCAACHQVAGKGAKVGPQLDGVGVRGADRLLEDVLDPNRNVDQAFRTTLLAMEDESVVTGLLLREEGEVLVLADAQGKEVRVQSKEVRKRLSQPLSPMPANFAELIPEADFHHLLAYLLSQKTPGH